MTVESNEFQEALLNNSANYGVSLSPQALQSLTDYSNLVNAWTPRLHLVAPASPETFAKRHVLESLLLLKHIPSGTSIVDLGSGGGLPIIPCLILRSDLSATLIESSKKKAVFLREALSQLGLSERATVEAQRFQDLPEPEAGFITSRALERFEEQIAKIVSWAPNHATFLFFGGEGLSAVLIENGLDVTPELIPNSERRFLFVARKLSDRQN